ncbi:MAG: hypothetical protein R2771_09170 [Saprospiraceae bacterium]
MAALGTGTWTLGAGSAGTATIVSDTDPTTEVTDFSAGGIYYLIWDNGICPDTAVVNYNCEICGNGVDDDGDGLIDCDDADCNPFVNLFSNPSMEDYICIQGGGSLAGSIADWELVNGTGEMFSFDPACLNRPSDIWPAYQMVNVPPSDGNIYFGIHNNNGGIWTNIIETVVHTPLREIIAGEQLDFQFDAYYLDFSHAVPPVGLLNNGSAVRVYGIHSGTDVSTINFAQCDVSTNPNVDFLGASPVVTNTGIWETYSLLITALNNYDRLIFHPACGPGSYLAFDNFKVAVYVPDLEVQGGSYNCLGSTILEITNVDPLIVSYDWYLDGIFLTNTASTVFTPTQSGVYTVVGLTTNGCESTESGPIVVPPCDCDDVVTGSLDVCAIVTANPSNPLATLDCDEDGETNAIECANNTDPGDPCDNSYVDGAEVCAYVMANQTSALALADCDNGGIDNLTECTNGGDPLDSGDDCDLVNNGIVDVCAILAGDPTNPLATVDCDGDGEDNASECAGGTDPANPCSNSVMPDTDGDGVVDECDLDDDNDGILDLVECPLVWNIQKGSGVWVGPTSANVTHSYSGLEFNSSSGMYNSLGTVTHSITYNFDNPIKASELMFRIIDVDNVYSAYFNVSGGTATTANFEMLNNSTFTLVYNPVTGKINRNGTNQNQGGSIVGLSDATLE